MSALSVIGSRGYSDLGAVKYGIDQYRGRNDTLISGGARGVDAAAEAYGLELGLHVVSYRPRRSGSCFVVHKFVDGQDIGPVIRPDVPEAFSWATFVEAAKTRNWWIAWEGFQVLAFWDGSSSGTAHGIAAAARTGRPLRIWMAGDS